jgi:hypothetical protein
MTQRDCWLRSVIEWGKGLRNLPSKCNDRYIWKYILFPERQLFESRITHHSERAGEPECSRYRVDLSGRPLRPP